MGAHLVLGGWVPQSASKNPAENLRCPGVVNFGVQSSCRHGLCLPLETVTATCGMTFVRETIHKSPGVN